jgi:hypothetical protein
LNEPLRQRQPLKKPVGLRPFWLSASNYYTFAAAMTIALFFLVWGILNEANEPTPWIGAGVLAGIVMAGAVLLREVILRMNRNRRLADQARLEKTLKLVAAFSNVEDRKKISLEQNNVWVAHIVQKSEAAKVLGRISEAHRNVFDLCEQYLGDIANEMPQIAPGSPRIAAFRTSAKRIQRLHRYHLLRWAELETSELGFGIQSRATIEDNSQANRHAARVLSFALDHYPDDPDLNASMSVINEARLMISAAELTENAEKERDQGNPQAALELYRDALDVLTRHPAEIDDSRERIIGGISAKIETIKSEHDLD